jgi:hypothetical protein
MESISAEIVAGPLEPEVDTLNGYKFPPTAIDGRKSTRTVNPDKGK